jgi:hypothetical protein
VRWLQSAHDALLLSDRNVVGISLICRVGYECLSASTARHCSVGNIPGIDCANLSCCVCWNS